MGIGGRSPSQGFAKAVLQDHISKVLWQAFACHHLVGLPVGKAGESLREVELPHVCGRALVPKIPEMGTFECSLGLLSSLISPIR
eukprot:1758198-Amphidinium_carterae.3